MYGLRSNLNSAKDVATFALGDSTYAIVTSYSHVGGVQLIDVSDPSSPIAVGAATHGHDGFTELHRAHGVAIFALGGSTYAIVAGVLANGVQVMQLSS